MSKKKGETGPWFSPCPICGEQPAFVYTIVRIGEEVDMQRRMNRRGAWIAVDVSDHYYDKVPTGFGCEGHVLIGEQFGDPIPVETMTMIWEKMA